MKTRLIITKLAQSKDLGGYIEFRITLDDNFIKMVKDHMGSYWDLIKEFEVEYQEFIQWLGQVKLT